ncbi:LysR family transcriptional regulator [Xylophilus sp. Leaf220]|uniref:LysR family transcriptional regulator n=1 Tax=Xylophilus sp. Leaf220 TaxID=1735686 RepID=UPI0009E7519A|nr:LysR family transcriptional regulator [Xylophilus sp. Leaf220]
MDTSHTAFDWTLLRSFLAVLDAGSLTAAARSTGMQQPTLSRHVAELESQLGAPLFERTGRGVTPTAAARAVVGAARQMQEAAAAVQRDLAAARSAAHGTVRITTSEAAAAWLLPPVLARLGQAHPQIQVELVASNDLSNLLRRDADIAVRMVRPVQQSLVARKLGEVEVVAAAHPRYLRAAPPLRSPDDLPAHRLIGFDRDETILRGFARAGLALARGDFALRTDNHIVYGRLVAEGAGLGFVARYAIDHWPGVVAVLPGFRPGALPCWLAVHREIRVDPRVRTVYDFLAREIPPVLAVGSNTFPRSISQHAPQYLNK